MRIPSSTYRIQFNCEFRYRDGEEILEYLSKLGISDVYSSPIFRAVTGSMHGYDVVDHNSINPDCGSVKEFKELHFRRKALGIGWIQDIVPNHMAFHGENLMLRNLLEHGELSKFRDFFDIDWNHTHESLKGRLLAPFLGGFYSESLDKGEIKLVYEEDGLFVQYYEHKYPLSLISYPMVFSAEEANYEGAVTGNLAMIKLQGILHQFKTLAESGETQTNYDGTVHAKKMLWNLYSMNIAIMEFMNNRLAVCNFTVDDNNADRLDAILEKQIYRLSFWKVAEEEINYRRFFNINGLISLKIENDEVFNFTHAFIKELIADGNITGIRIDHVDGLYNPLQYLRRLKHISDDLFIIVEKIIEQDEKLPDDWPVQGTTGYDFLNQLNGIYCKTENENSINRIYSGFTNLNINYEELAAEKKRIIIEKNMTGDVDNLASLLKTISGNDRFGRDITMHGLRNALVEIIAYFPVYRTYIDSEKISNSDAGHISTAFERARRYRPEYSFEYNFLEKCLTLQYLEKMDEAKTAKLLHFIMRFQQYTGPFMAKGFEDTVLYIANRLISLNEVGGNPGLFGISAARFHDFIRRRFQTHRHSINATSTHDTKRGEDVRCRINVISELPGEWKNAVKEWSRLNHKRQKRDNGLSIPDKNDEYFFYQTLAGSFPFSFDEYDLYVQRIKDYMIKSVREARVHTAWVKPDSVYEDNLIRFIDRVLLPLDGNKFIEKFIPFQKKIAFFGILNSLSQIIIKIASPGVPDFYQGTELWNLHLVDPDNRKKVDFRTRKEYLKNIVEREIIDISGFLKELWETRESGCIKLFLIRRLLLLRSRMKELFSEGEYIPLETSGKYKNSVIAFLRSNENETVIAVAPRFLTEFIREGELPVSELWEDTAILIPGFENYKMKDAITGVELNINARLMLRDILLHFPGSLLVCENKMTKGIT